MSYKVRVAPSTAQRITANLPEPAAAACVQFLVGPLTDTPRSVGTPLCGPYYGHWQSERGTYLVRYRIDDDTGHVDVVDVELTIGRGKSLLTADL